MTRKWAFSLPGLAMGMLACPLLAQPEPPDGIVRPGMQLGGPMADRKILARYDKDGDKRLNKEERTAARDAMRKEREGGGGRRMGPPGGGGIEPGRPGPHVEVADATVHADRPLYDPAVLRTFFLKFEDEDWEQALADFYHTDVEIPATLIVDGKTYPNVGVHFRGASSYMMIPAGSKRSLAISMDYADKKQRLYGAKSLNWLNAHDDAAFMSSMLYSHIARQYIPAPKVNYAKVVINGESWGVYVNTQQFDKEFLEENYKSSKGTRWKVGGSPGGGGGLEYAGDSVENYKRRYEIKSGDNQKSWQALIKLCKTLNETPADKLPDALAPMLDIDGLLWFLALDVALINCDGYWIRASDYCLYLDEKGKFHVVPHDMNESFRAPQGPGFGGGPMVVRLGTPGEILPGPMQEMLNLSGDQKKQIGDLQKDVDAKLAGILTEEQKKQFRELRDRGPAGFAGGPSGRGGRGPGGPGGPGGPAMNPVRGVELDPLVGLDDARKPLRSKILAVPAWREQYLRNLRTIADRSLDWNHLGPFVKQCRALIEKEVEADTRKLDSFADFQRATGDAVPSANPERRRGNQTMHLRSFADQRRKFLLDHAEVKKAMK